MENDFLPNEPILKTEESGRAEIEPDQTKLPLACRPRAGSGDPACKRRLDVITFVITLWPWFSN
jgi:hypothetical protein